MPDTNIPAEHRSAWIDLIFAMADDSLMLGHRNSDWTGLAPTLEEDIAFSSLAQDDIGHALTLFQALEGVTGKSADELAYGREPSDYRCAEVTWVSDDSDWATAIARQFFCAHFKDVRCRQLVASSNTALSAIARRIRAEEAVHLEHANGWLRRFGLEPIARVRIDAALARLSTTAIGLAEPTAGQAELIAAGLYPNVDGFTPAATWRRRVNAALESFGYQTRLPKFADDGSDIPAGGRRGRHAPGLTEVLDEMCEVFRLEPGAAW